MLGHSYLPLRLVSLVASLVCFAILAGWSRRDGERRAAGIAAAGLLAATYFAAHTWFDVARVDSLFLALSVAALYAARRAYRTRGAIAAGCCLGRVLHQASSACGKCRGPRCAGGRASPAARRGGRGGLAAVVGGSTLALGLASHGWYVYYVFEQMSQHASQSQQRQPVLDQRAAAHARHRHLRLLCSGARRMPLVLLAGCAALAVEAFAARAENGSNLNDLLPVYMIIAVLAGLAMGGQPALSPRVAGRFARPPGSHGSCSGAAVQSDDGFPLWLAAWSSCRSGCWRAVSA